MRDLSPSQSVHFEAQVTTLATLWRLSRRDGFRLHLTDYGQSLDWDGERYQPSGAPDLSSLLRNTAARLDAGAVEAVLADEALSEGDLKAGLWDGAQVEAWLVDWTDMSNAVRILSAWLGEIAVKEGRFTAQVLGPGALLHRSVGRLYGRSCDAALGDARCGVSLTSPAYRKAAQVSEKASSVVRVTGLGDAASGLFTKGIVLRTGDRRIKIERHWREANLHWLELDANALALNVGESITVLAGCDQSAERCRNVFNNIANFRGFPHLIGADGVISGPDERTPMDGRSRWKA